MKRTLLSIIYLFIIFCCHSQPPKPQTSESKTSHFHDEKRIAPIIKVYIENSGSMDGYVKGATDFENAVYSYLSDIQYANIGEITDSTSTKNTLILNYINSKVLQQTPDLKEFIAALEPSDFKLKGGNRGTSDISNIISTILSQTGDNDVAMLISDCIFSPGKKYKARDNADEYIVAQQIGIKSHIVEKLAQNPNFSIVVMRSISQFNGIYYNKFDEQQPINNTRPFYIWLMGDRSHLKSILDAVDINQMKGKGIQNIFMISNPVQELLYNISLPTPGNGKYKLDNRTKTISKVKVDGKGSNTRFQISISVDFSKTLLDEEYLTNPKNYLISNKAYNLEVFKYSGPIKDKYTHTIRLILTQPIISRGTINISLLNTTPQWINDYTDESGLDINLPGAMEQTYGLKYLLGGIIDAYSSSKNYGNITITIK